MTGVIGKEQTESKESKPTEIKINGEEQPSKHNNEKKQRKVIHLMLSMKN